MTNFKKMMFAISLVAVLLTVAVIIGITRQQPTISHSQDVTLTINAAPDFSLTVLPLHVVSFVDREIAYTAEVISIDNFAGDIVFSDAGVPAGVTVTYFPNNTLTLGAGGRAGVQINLSIPADAPLGDSTITITAESTVYN